MNINRTSKAGSVSKRNFFRFNAESNWRAAINHRANYDTTQESQTRTFRTITSLNVRTVKLETDNGAKLFSPSGHISCVWR